MPRSFRISQDNCPADLTNRFATRLVSHENHCCAFLLKMQFLLVASHTPHEYLPPSIRRNTYTIAQLNSNQIQREMHPLVRRLLADNLQQQTEDSLRCL